MKHIYTRFLMYAHTVRALLVADLLTFKENFVNKLLDTSIILIANLLVMGYILPELGLTRDYGPFMLSGLLSSVAVFESYSFVATLVNDMAGDKKLVSYLCSLPIPSWLAFTQMIISLAIRSIVMGIMMFILGKIFLGSQLPLNQPSYGYSFVMLVLGGIFAATLALWIASNIKDRSLLSSAWTRFLFPLWIFGGFQFSWSALHKAFPRASYINLLNPLLYSTEGLRNALNLPGKFIPVWICVIMLILFTGFFGRYALYRLKKRLDYI